jgi:hypothetical protein
MLGEIPNRRLIKKKNAPAHEKNTIPGSILEEILINDGWIKRIPSFLQYEAIDWRKRKRKRANMR